MLAKDYVPKGLKFAECYRHARNSLKTAKYDHKQKKKKADDDSDDDSSVVKVDWVEKNIYINISIFL